MEYGVVVETLCFAVKIFFTFQLTANIGCLEGRRCFQVVKNNIRRI